MVSLEVTILQTKGGRGAQAWEGVQRQDCLSCSRPHPALVGRKGALYALELEPCPQPWKIPAKGGWRRKRGLG